MAWIYVYPVRYLSYLIPVNILIWLTRGLAPLYARLRGDLVAPIKQHMTISFEGHVMPASAAVMARSFLANDLHKALDDLIMHRLKTETLKKYATVRGIEFLDEALGKGKGVIVISAHFHANRLAKYYLRRTGYSLTSIRTRVPKSTRMGRFGNRFVAPAYGRILNTIVEDEIHIQDAGLGAKLLRRLRENGIVNIHIDAGFSREKFRLTYLNQPRQFAGGFLRLAELTGAPLVPMYCLGNSRGFEVVFDKPIQYTKRSSPETFMNRLLKMAGLLESWVLAHPTEWVMWTQPNRRRKK